MLSAPISGWTRIFVLGIGGFLVGALLFGALTTSGNGEFELQSTLYAYPAAYQLPKIPGGTSLRMAMVHDVLLDRYLRHGDAWYTRRNELSRAILAETPPPSTAPSATLDVQRLDTMDDLAVGLEFLHHSDEAIAVMRDKLKSMPPTNLPAHFVSTESREYDVDLEDAHRIEAASNLSVEMHHQYTAYANLGTSLIHSSMAKALAGDATARKQLAEGLADINQSIAINPAAHFGREIWQAVAVRHFMASFNDPQFLIRFDMVGNSMTDVGWRGKRAWPDELHSSVAELDAQASLEKRLNLRLDIFKTGINPEWLTIVGGEPRWPVHFDEPALALMGMWMFGGGPNPHSAMALAHIAQQVNQLEIAWDGYERALEMQSAFSDDPAIKDALVKHCRDQQALIAAAELPSDSEGWASRTRQRHNDELAWARHYQDEYHAWEARQIAAGIPLDSPEFYKGFFQGRPSIASPVGHSDEIGRRIFSTSLLSNALPGGLFFAGTLMFLGAISARPKSAKR